MKKVAVLVALLALTALGASMAFAHGQDGGAPEAVYNIPWDNHNSGCPGGSGSAWSTRIDPVVSGTYGPVTITVNGDSFSWVLNDSVHYDMGAVMVKGGPSDVRVYVYDYADAVSYDDASSGLVAATNPHNGKPYGLSHITICLDPKGGGDN
jgi:hypothetical protein